MDVAPIDPKVVLPQNDAELKQMRAKGDQAVDSFNAMLQQFIDTYSGGEGPGVSLSPGEMSAEAAALERLTPEIAVATPSKASALLLETKNQLDSWVPAAKQRDYESYSKAVDELGQAYTHLVTYRDAWEKAYWSNAVDTIPDTKDEGSAG